ncbi:CurL C-terminal domain-containing protein, partial [Shouchella clausii]|uniref:CurL C-terminal domain-containing protein n=1 Tax=Shouchella clausii TaxID=79880 RepID=UPI003F5A6441
MHSYLTEGKDALLEDISYTLNCRRSKHPYRFSAVVHDRAELIIKLVMATNADIHRTESPGPVTVWL